MIFGDLFPARESVAPSLSRFWLSNRLKVGYDLMRDMDISADGNDRYFTHLAVAFVRGKLGHHLPPDLSLDEIIKVGLASGLRLHKFKRNAELPRVRKILGILQGLGPASVLDIGSGRGTFLWPLLDAFPHLQVTALDVNPLRVADLNSVRAGGISNLQALQMDSGLSGAGKDYWAAEHLPDWPLISLDGFRREMKISPTANQGPVISRAREIAREHLRRKQSFIGNATNISRQIRELSINLFAAYNARVHIVYVEAPEQRLYSQNRERTNAIPAEVIRRLTRRWEVPDMTEAHRVDWIENSHGAAQLITF